MCDGALGAARTTIWRSACSSASVNPAHETTLKIMHLT